MSYRRKSYTYEDGDAIFPIPFDYIEQDDILVFINDEQTTDFVIENTQVKLNNKPIETPAIIKIVSVTDIDKAAVEWENVSSLDEDNLILSDNQIRYAVQELYDNTEQFKVDINNTLSEVNEAARIINTTIETVDEAVNTTQEQATIATEQANLATQQSELVASTANKALEDIDTLRTNIINELDTIVEDSVETVSGLANEITNNAQNIINRLGINLFDTKISDHILEGEEALGWALQGTYVYKNGVAGSRIGYADFYAKCLAEKELGTGTETTLGDNTITMYVNANGHKFYDIADKTVVDNWYNTYGIADFYGIDTENERVFLPRDKYFAVTGGVAVAGNGKALGVTDGKTDYYLRNGVVGTGNSAVLTPGTSQELGTGSSSVSLSMNYGIGISTDSTKSGIEGQLTPNENKYLYICVGNTKVESAISNVTEITTSENDTLPLFYNFYSKEDMTTTGAYYNASLGEFLSGNDYKTAYAELEKRLGTGNVKSINDEYTDYDFVVNQDNMTFRLPLLNGDRVLVEKKEATTEDPTWYNLYNDGWLEQGGNVATAGTNVVLTLNFLKSFSNTDYYFNRSAIKKTADGNNATTFTGCQNKTTSSVQFYCENAAYVYSYDWYAEGYTSIPNTNTNLYYKVDNAVTNLELLDVAKVMNEAVLKSSLVEANVIVESYVNGTSGYNVYSNGYCEQWGCYKFKGVHGTSYTITLLKEMKDTNYLTYRGGTYGIGVTSAVFVSELSKATDSFVIYYGSQTGGSFDVIYNWKACGYIK